MVEMYSEEELNVLERHIETHFGKYDGVFHEIASPDIHVDICIISPTSERDYYTLVTMGMGAHLMNVPDSLKEHKLERAELCISLPANWKIDDQDEKWYWPLRWLKVLARLPIEEDSWLGWGHTVANPGEKPFAENTGFSGVVLLSPGGFREEAAVCEMPDGSEVNFYDVVPLYREEMDYKCRHNAQALLQLFQDDPDDIQLMPLDLGRKNVCQMKKKSYHIKAEDVKPLLCGWYGPEGCIATDRITVDGSKVGYCYRERPDEDDKAWDSGWRFLAGDEDDDYMDDPDNSGIYALNTICNDDPEVIFLLKSPYGSAFARDEYGVFQSIGEAEDESKASPLLGEEDIEVLKSFEDDRSGYYGKMLGYLEDFIKSGVEEGRFTEREAHSDLDIALWYSYACNNLDDYEHYYLATQWMPSSERNAEGCGTWYYRYSCALMYCGRLEEALAYSERGVREEPCYPWGWLQLAKLRSHFNDRDGALEAVARGLELEPGDYEFTTLRREIEDGLTLPEMEYHYIDPESDRQLREGLLMDKDDKLRAIAGIICDDVALEHIKRLFNPTSWEADCPYCTCHISIQGRTVETMFRMNEAALSKIDFNWLKSQREKLENVAYLTRNVGEIPYDLQSVVFDRDHTAQLVYCNPEGETFSVRVSKSGEQADIPEPFVLDMALAKAEEEDTDDGGTSSMVKLYRKGNGMIEYAECWEDNGNAVEHTGKVGEVGNVREHPMLSLKSYSSFMTEFEKRYSFQGYSRWPEDEENWLVVQFPINPIDMNAEPIQVASEDEALRDQVEGLLKEALGWTGLGDVDGWEVGRCIQAPDVYVLNVYCVVVDHVIGVKIVSQTLCDEVDCSHLKIAVMPAGFDDYTLAYSADGSEDFSL